MKRFDAVEPDEFDSIVAINLKSVWYGIKRAYAPMCERGGGAIVNVSSMAGLRPNRHHSRPFPCSRNRRWLRSRF